MWEPHNENATLRHPQPSDQSRRSGLNRDIRSDFSQRPMPAKPNVPTAPSTAKHRAASGCYPLVKAEASRSIAPTAPYPVTRSTKKKKDKPSYASLPRDMLASARALAMTGLGLRVLLTAHAQWRGKPPLVLSSKALSTMLKMERSRFARGREEVMRAGFLIRTRDYIRPGGAGSATETVRRAAEYDIPYAHSGAQVDLGPGDRRLPGYWRILSSDLLTIVGRTSDENGELCPFLTDDQLRVMIAFTQGARTKGGALADPAQHRVTAQAIVSLLPQMTIRTAQRALAALQTRGLARMVSGGAGRAPAVYEPTGLLTEGLPWEHKRKP